MCNVLFLHGFYPRANNTIVPGGWSIGTEMAFYVIFPFLFAISQKGSLQSLRKNLLWIFFSLLVSQLLLLAFGSFYKMHVNNNNFLQWNLVTQFPVFCIGMAYYYLEINNSLKTNYKQDILIFILFTGSSLFLWRLHIGYLFSIIPLISALSFVFLIKIFKEIQWLNYSLLMRIGTVSYSMYLIHFIVLNKLAGFIAVKLNGILTGTSLLILIYFITIAGSFGLAILSEKYIEKPFINLGKKIINKI